MTTEIDLRKNPNAADYIREAIEYDAEKGTFRWLCRPQSHFATKRAWKSFNTRYAGERAGSNVNLPSYVRGYGWLAIAWKKYPLSHIAYLYMTGDWPDNHVIPTGLSYTDLRWENLVLMDSSTRLRLIEKSNKGLDNYRGVHLDKIHNTWRARIRVDGKELSLGKFHNEEDAIAARKVAEKKYGYKGNKADSSCNLVTSITVRDDRYRSEGLEYAEELKLNPKNNARSTTRESEGVALHAKKHLSYNADTGVIKWKLSPAVSVQVGDIAGPGTIYIKNKGFSPQRIAWLLHYGEWPQGKVFSADGNKKNIRIVNLHIPPAGSWRRRVISKNNKSGYVGVGKAKGRDNDWTAHVRYNGKTRSLGIFDTLEEAVAAREKAVSELEAV